MFYWIVVVKVNTQLLTDSCAGLLQKRTYRKHDNLDNIYQKLKVI